MRSVNQASRALCALAKTLIDNARRMTEQEREALTEAVYRTVMERQRIPVNVQNQERMPNADPISNR